MPSKPLQWTIPRLLALPREETVIWCTPSCSLKVQELLPFKHATALTPTDIAISNLIVVGGGTLIDVTKAWRKEYAPTLNLVAVPSIWGSGAEASPISVLENEGGTKRILMGDEYLPDAFAFLDELAESLPGDRAVLGCGDAWSHALEGILSPLATAALKVEFAILLGEMLSLGLGSDPQWFGLSAKACSLQSRAGVGLVHGIAHSLEKTLRQKYDTSWGHARLCSLFLYPVLQFNIQASPKFADTLKEHSLDIEKVLETARTLFDEQDYDLALTELTKSWRTVLRDPCTRTNSALVRPRSIEYFQEKAFE